MTNDKSAAKPTDVDGYYGDAEDTGDLDLSFLDGNAK